MREAVEHAREAREHAREAVEHTRESVKHTMSSARRSLSLSRHRQPDHDITEFFARNSLPPNSLEHCMHYAKTRLPKDTVIEPLRTQGYCSLTLLAATEPVASIIQFRPEAHRLDLTLSNDVRSIFGPVAPQTRALGYIFLPAGQDGHEEHHEHRRRRLRDILFHRHRRNRDAEEDEKEKELRQREREDHVTLHVYAMAYLPGTPLTAHRLARLPPDVAGAHRAALVRSLAQHFATAWRQGRYPDAPRRPQTLVASSLRGRLEAMSHSLPPRFRGTASQVLARLPQIEALPWVMTHGDLVPVNVLVDPRRGNVSGLIDWAEAEYLPFGTGLYGVEEILSHAASLPEEETEGRKRWGYYPDIGPLRELFWSELLGMVPELREGGTMETVRLAGQMGVLLWCGIAFDDGKLDRVIQEGKDASEVAKLDLFLLDPEGCKYSSSMQRMEEEARYGRRAAAAARGRMVVEKPAPMFEKTDDEENVQELGQENPIRYKL